MAGQIDLASIIGQAAQTNANQTGYAQAESGQYQKAAGQQGVVADNIERAGDLESQAKLTELTGELNTQQARVKAANALGTNINDVSNIITDLGAQYRQDAMGLIDAQNKVSDLEANNDLLTNPLGWFKDLLIGGNARAQRDALAQKVDTEAKTIQNLNSLTQTTVQTQNAISETLSATSIAQTAAAISAKAAAQAAEARTNAAKYGAASIEALAQADSQNFSRNMQAYNAVQENERMNMARQEHNDRMKALGDANAELQDTVDNINEYNKKIGKPPVTTLMVKKYYGSQGELGDQMRRADQGGFKLRQNGGSLVGIFGPTPADFYFTAVADNVDLPDAFQPSKTILKASQARFEDVRSQVSSSQNQNGVTIIGSDGQKHILTKESFKTTEQAKATYNLIVGEQARNFQSAIVPGTGNPYEALPISSVLQSPDKYAHDLATSNFGKTVLANLQATKIEQPTPELFMQTALASVDKKEITMAEAIEGVNKFYIASTNLKSATGGFLVTNVPNSASYNVPVDFLQRSKLQSEAPDYSFFEKISGIALYKEVGSAIANKPTAEERSVQNLKPLDLMKPQDVTTAMTILQSARMRNKILNNTGAQTQ